MDSAAVDTAYTEYWRAGPATWVCAGDRLVAGTGRALRHPHRPPARPERPPTEVPAGRVDLLRVVGRPVAAVPAVAAAIPEAGRRVEAAGSCRALDPADPADTVTVPVRYYPVVVVDTVASVDCRDGAEAPIPVAGGRCGTAACRVAPDPAPAALRPVAAVRARAAVEVPTDRSCSAGSDGAGRPDGAGAVDVIEAAS